MRANSCECGVKITGYFAFSTTSICPASAFMPSASRTSGHSACSMMVLTACVTPSLIPRPGPAKIAARRSRDGQTIRRNFSVCAGFQRYKRRLIELCRQNRINTGRQCQRDDAGSRCAQLPAPQKTERRCNPDSRKRQAHGHRYSYRSPGSRGCICCARYSQSIVFMCCLLCIAQ